MSPYEFDRRVIHAQSEAHALEFLSNDAWSKVETKGLGSLSDGQKSILVAYSLVREIVRTSFDQAFIQSVPGKLAPDASRCLKLLGLDRYAELVDKAAERCKIVSDGRSDLFFPMPEYLIDGFEDLNEDMRGLYRQDQAKYGQRLLAYAEQHQADFIDG